MYSVPSVDMKIKQISLEGHVSPIIYIMCKKNPCSPFDTYKRDSRTKLCGYSQWQWQKDSRPITEFPVKDNKSDLLATGMLSPVVSYVIHLPSFLCYPSRSRHLFHTPLTPDSLVFVCARSSWSAIPQTLQFVLLPWGPYSQTFPNPPRHGNPIVCPILS